MTDSVFFPLIKHYRFCSCCRQEVGSLEGKFYGDERIMITGNEVHEKCIRLECLQGSEKYERIIKIEIFI